MGEPAGGARADQAPAPVRARAPAVDTPTADEGASTTPTPAGKGGDALPTAGTAPSSPAMIKEEPPAAEQGVGGGVPTAAAVAVTPAPTPTPAPPPVQTEPPADPKGPVGAEAAAATSVLPAGGTPSPPLPPVGASSASLTPAPTPVLKTESRGFAIAAGPRVRTVKCEPEVKKEPEPRTASPTPGAGGPVAPDGAVVKEEEDLASPSDAPDGDDGAADDDSCPGDTRAGRYVPTRWLASARAFEEDFALMVGTGAGGVYPQGVHANGAGGGLDGGDMNFAKDWGMLERRYERLAETAEVVPDDDDELRDGDANAAPPKAKPRTVEDTTAPAAGQPHDVKAANAEGGGSTATRLGSAGQLVLGPGSGGGDRPASTDARDANDSASVAGSDRTLSGRLGGQTRRERLQQRRAKKDTAGRRSPQNRGTTAAAATAVSPARATSSTGAGGGAATAPSPALRATPGTPGGRRSRTPDPSSPPPSLVGDVDAERDAVALADVALEPEPEPEEEAAAVYARPLHVIEKYHFVACLSGDPEGEEAVSGSSGTAVDTAPAGGDAAYAPAAALNDGGQGFETVPIHVAPSEAAPVYAWIAPSIRRRWVLIDGECQAPPGSTLR